MLCVRLLTIIAALVFGIGKSFGQMQDSEEVLRSKVIELMATKYPVVNGFSQTPTSNVGRAYKAYFEKLGKSGLKEAMKDKNTGIALQAAWEVHKQPAEKKITVGRSERKYDPEELEKFLAFLKERTKAPVPEWWGVVITNNDVFYEYLYGEFKDIKIPKLIESSGEAVPEGDKLVKNGDVFTYISDKHAVDFRKSAFMDCLDILAYNYCVLFSKEVCFFAFFDGSFGVIFGIDGF